MTKIKSFSVKAYWKKFGEAEIKINNVLLIRSNISMTKKEYKFWKNRNKQASREIGIVVWYLSNWEEPQFKILHLDVSTLIYGEVAGQK